MSPFLQESHSNSNGNCTLILPKVSSLIRNFLPVAMHNFRRTLHKSWAEVMGVGVALSAPETLLGLRPGRGRGIVGARGAKT